MKKIFLSIVLVCFILFPSSVMAEGYISTGTKTLTIEQGSKKTFTITAYNSVGDVTITSENSSIAKVSPGFFETGIVGEGTTKKGTITVTGVSIGTTKIKLDVDGATFSGDKLGSKDQEIVVNVVAKKVDTRSSNNKLKSITAEGYDLVKVNDTNYTLTVGNGVTSIKITAVAEDSKANVTGTGVYDLKTGENKITVTVTAENGSKNTITVKVTRKDGYYLEDLSRLLKESNKDIDIILDKNSKITKEDINNIKNSGKNVSLNYYDSNKKLLYSWIIDGNNIKGSSDVVTSISSNPRDEKIYEKINYSEGIFVSLLNEGNVPEGIKVRVNVSDKYSNGDKVNIYHYGNSKLTLVGNEVRVVDGYIEFKVNKNSDYFITKANLNVVSSGVMGMNIYIIISVVEFLVIMVLLFIKKKGNKGENVIYSGKLEKLFMVEENIFPTTDKVIN